MTIKTIIENRRHASFLKRTNKRQLFKTMNNIRWLLATYKRIFWREGKMCLFRKETKTREDSSDIQNYE